MKELTAEEIKALQPQQQMKEKEDLVRYIGGSHCKGCDGIKFTWSLFCSECWSRLPDDWKNIITDTPVFSVALARQCESAEKFLRLEF